MKKIILLLLLYDFSSHGFSQIIKARFPASVMNKPFSGHVILYLSKENKSPKDAFVGLEIFPCASIRISNVLPGREVVFDDKALSYPVPLSSMERGDYYMQVIWDRNLGGRAISASPGNFYNKTRRVRFTGDHFKVFTVECDQVLDTPRFQETVYIKELRAPSALLSKFAGRPATVDAAVLLPKEYLAQPDRKFPVLFIVFGYGGDYHGHSGDTVPARPLDTTSVIRVFLDGNCPLGHSVYANSDNNGPWGDALTTEFIPLLEKKYRCDGARLLTGHSSGGWTVLWLQTHYPKIFAGCASSSPDPVDFRNFQKINLYADHNMFYGPDSTLRSVATVAGFFQWASMKNIYQMEKVIYRGEQMHSFDAVFSAMGKDGSPERLCDPLTGTINPATFAHWKRYDISLYLRTHWDQLRNDLEGKVRVSVGEQDNFLLNYAVHMLDDEMKKISTGFQFVYYPGDHFTVFTPQYRKDIDQFLEERYLAWTKTNKTGPDSSL